MVSRSRLQALVQVVAGLALNAFPAMFIAVYARIAPIEAQGFLAVSLTVGVYVAQLFNAFVVEGRLATPGADQNLSLPRWVGVLVVAAGALLSLGPLVAPPWILIAGSVGIMTGLLMARSIGVVCGRWKSEAVGAVLLLATSLVALVLAARQNPHCVQVLALGGVAAILVRWWPRTAIGVSGMPPDVRRASWVTAETAVLGVVQPTLTYLVLMILGPAASVTFRVISTVSGALEPILAYGRYRLLAHGHKGELATFVLIFSAGLIAVLVAALGGLGELIFGSAWSGVGAVVLVIACMWKLVMLISTVPFAALRKAGATKLVFWIRGFTTVAYLAFGIGFLLLWDTVMALFIGFVVAELVTAVVYHFVAKKRVDEYDLTLRSAALVPGAVLARRWKRSAK
ncbi:hypothetical protein H7I77_23820 [Mycolicibacterium novocastrense]|uniref:Polysaccharide biosynthesis protein n=1 Tax=Mycolicibacterium novocastrense TaxID=59813 RepID=A0AAW5SRH3_MYCNV|nr:hypothetical protein [Mycolicibacterium novocastrense]MCV7026343.1 hypothetical protein [Mycolicibacterium novocastrense]